MERAAAACFSWLEGGGYLDCSFTVYCGKGNNGGDGLALRGCCLPRTVPVTVQILEFGHLGTEDFQANLARLHPTPVEISFIQEKRASILFPRAIS